MKKFVRKIKDIKKSRLISYLLLVIILVYGLSFSILFSFALDSVFSIIKSVKVPNGYYLSDLDPLDPKFEVAFYIDNRGFWDISGFSIDISESILYFENNNSEPTSSLVFQKQVFIGKILSGRIFSDIIHSNYSDFNIGLLEDFANTVNMSRGIYEFLSVSIRGKYFIGLIPFKVLVDSLCLTCGEY